MRFEIVTFEFRTVEHLFAHVFDCKRFRNRDFSKVRRICERLRPYGCEVDSIRKVEFSQRFEVHTGFCGNFADFASCAAVYEFRGNNEFAHRIVRNLVDTQRAVRFDGKPVFEHDFAVICAESCKVFLRVVARIEHPLDVAFRSRAVNARQIDFVLALIIAVNTLCFDVLAVAFDEFVFEVGDYDVNFFGGRNRDFCNALGIIRAVLESAELYSREFLAFDAER